MKKTAETKKYPSKNEEAKSEAFQNPLKWEYRPYSEVMSRKMHASVLFEHLILTFGGITSNGKILQDLVCLELTSEKTTEQMELQGNGRYGHTLSIYSQNFLIIYGGQSESGITNETLVVRLTTFRRIIY